MSVHPSLNHVNFSGLGPQLDLGFRNLFSNLSTHALSLLEENAIEIFFKKGQEIYKEGRKTSGIFYLVEGKVKFFRSDNANRHIIVGFSKCNNLIGASAVFNDDMHTVSASCIENCKALFIPKSVVLQVIELDPAFLRIVVLQINSKMTQVIHHMSCITFKSIRESVALAIMELNENFGQDRNGYIDVILTKAEIGQMAGTTTSAAIKLTNEFEKDGMIEINEKKIRIVNMPRLSRTAGISTHAKLEAFNSPYNKALQY